ncbi:thiazole biosynthesis protein ThiI [Lactobacillus iners LactinV 01V1-a]|uniref:Thiazole biosynthesis protein ThiI n=1 Tax=Lactobacillus iners LactinV 01V1-a TaxID=879297 RepID=E1NS44_9LACO|nr:thiazole biosynthesis protein ThiI [Lactobacillus iners LactinV 01V1-a]
MVNCLLKGKNRRDFIAKLADNIQKALSTFPAIKIYPKHDRLHIILNGAPFDEIDQN